MQLKLAPPTAKRANGFDFDVAITEGWVALVRSLRNSPGEDEDGDDEENRGGRGGVDMTNVPAVLTSDVKNGLRPRLQQNKDEFAQRAHDARSENAELVDRVAECEEVRADAAEELTNLATRLARAEDVLKAEKASMSSHKAETQEELEMLQGDARALEEELTELIEQVRKERQREAERELCIVCRRENAERALCRVVVRVVWCVLRWEETIPLATHIPHTHLFLIHCSPYIMVLFLLM